MSEFDGGPAFPLKEPLSSDSEGISLRDYFAAKAVAALIAEPLLEGQSTMASGWKTSPGYGPEMYAEAAYKLADAMLAERTKGREK